MRVLGLDVGTTRVKCGVYDEDGTLVFSGGRDHGIKKWGNEVCLDLPAMFSCVRELMKEAYAAAPFSAVAISSLGESFALLDGEDRLLLPPMSFGDLRGEEEARAYSGHVREIFAASGVAPQAMYSAYRLLWIKKHRPALFKRAEKVLLIADYLGYFLTGERLCDRSSAARTGLYDIRNYHFSAELCELFGLDSALFSPTAPCGTVVGEVRREFLAEWGAGGPVFVVTGGHDQICATLGAGGFAAGVCVDGLGTVECMTALYDMPSLSLEMGLAGYPNVPYAIDGMYATYLLNYSCGSLVRWWLDTAWRGERDPFTKAEAEFSPTPTGLYILPYFSGAATPFQDVNARGAILNLRLATTPSDVYKGILEGLSYEMRLNLEETKKYGISPERLLASGGGAASKAWLQIKADVTGLPVFPPKVKETGVCGAAILAGSAMQNEPVRDVAERFVRLGEPVLPNAQNKARYDELFAGYRRLYQTLKSFEN